MLDSPEELEGDMETLTANGGVAPGAKLSVFDVISDDSLIVWAFLASNGLWDAAENTGCRVHSNSWGTAESTCETDTMSVEFDRYMYEVSFLSLGLFLCFGRTRIPFVRPPARSCFSSGVLVPTEN